MPKALSGGLHDHLPIVPAHVLSPVLDPEPTWGLLAAYAMPLGVCTVLLLLCYRYRTSTRAPHGLRRAARFECWAERVLFIDALLVGLGTPVVLGACLIVWFLPTPIGLEPASMLVVASAVAFLGATMAIGWLAPDSTLRVAASGIGIVLALNLTYLDTAERFALACVPLFALLWFAFVLPFGQNGAPRRFRPSALIGALLLFVVSSAPLLLAQYGPADTPLVAGQRR